MIGEYTLKKLCDKYGLNADKLIKKNNNILDYGEYLNIDKTLDYLINVLKINSNNIEKCPSILYRNVRAIKENIDFLKNLNINFSDIETCLHVLSAEPSELKETYEYVKDNYGLAIINRLTSILSVPKSVICSVENLGIPFVNKNGNLSVAVGVEWGSTNIEEVQKIIQSPEFKAHPELFTSTTLAYAKLEDIQQLLRMECWQDPRFKTLLSPSIVAKSKSMIDKIPILIKLAEDNEIDNFLNTSFLIFSPSQNYAIIEYLKTENKPLVIDGKLNPIFGKQPVVLKKKYGIDLKAIMQQFPFDITDNLSKNGEIKK